LIGDLPELGNWDVTESIPLIWHEVINIKLGKYLEEKCKNFLKKCLL
jgi:hypothetical protein